MPRLRKGSSPTLLAGVLLALAAPILAAILLIGLMLTRATPSVTETPIARVTTALAPRPAYPPAATALFGYPLAAPSSSPSVALAETASPTSIRATSASSATSPRPATSTTTASSPGVPPSPTVVTATLPPATASASPSFTPTGAAVTSTPTAVGTILADGKWILSGLRWYFDPDFNAIRLVGEMTNNSRSTQLLVAVNGRFYDSQGGLIADETSAVDSWPQEVVPPGARVPFDIYVFDVQSTDSYSVTVDSDESPVSTRTDFETNDISQWLDAGRYCVEGKLRNNGDRLRNSLVVIATLYDDQDRVINYGADVLRNSPVLYTISGDTTWNFRICISPPNDGLARPAVVQAFGR